MRDVTRGTLTAAVVATVTVLAGCGVVDKVRYPYADEDPDKVLRDAFEATADLKAVRISGFLEPAKGPRITFNLLNAENGSCGGTMSFSTADFDVVLTDEQTYLKGSTASWQQMPGITREQGIVVGPVLADRWVLTGTPKEGPDPNPLCRFVDVLTKEESEEKYDVTNKGLSEAAGMKAVKIDAANDKRSLDLWVDVEEPHHLLKIVQTEKNESVEIVLSDFDSASEVRTPPKKDVLDPTKLSAEDFRG